MRGTPSLIRPMTLCLLSTVLAWAIASNWLTVSWLSPPSDAGRQVYMGSTSGMAYVGIAQWSSPGTPHLRAGLTHLDYVWGFDVTWTRALRQVLVPLWVIAAVLLIPAALAWRRRARSPMRLCPRCEYPVGVSARCTECGGRVA